MTSLNKKIEILEKNGLIPSGLNIPIDCKIVDVQAGIFEYSGYKYSESDESFRNTIVSIEMKHKFLDKSFFVNIFDGATYRDTNILNVTISLNPVIENGESKVDYIEDVDCLTEENDDEIEGFDILKEISFAFKCRLFTGDEAGLYIPEDEKAILNGNYGFLETIASEIIKENFLVLNAKISRDTPDAKEIEEIYYNLENIAEDKLYKVTVIVDNQLLCYIPFLTKEDAEAKFINCCVEYTAIKIYAIDNKELNKEIMNLSQWQDYMNTKDNSKDNSFIAISNM